MHMEESPLCHTYVDTVPASLMAEVLEKPDEACSSSQASRSPSPQTQDHTFILERLGPGERLGLRAAYKSDLYSSDTALYCPDDRHRERRPSVDLHGPRKLQYGPQNSTDSNPEEGSVGLRAGFSQEHFAKFPATLGQALAPTPASVEEAPKTKAMTRPAAPLPLRATIPSTWSGGMPATMRGRATHPGRGTVQEALPTPIPSSKRI